MEKMKLLITGGHVTPALAVIDRIVSSPLKDTVDILYIGRKYALDSEDTYSLEYKEISRRNIRFISLVAGRLTRVLSFRSLANLLKTPIGFIHAASILISEKPDRILSFGGYIALPIAIVGWLMGIPVFTHEQTIRPGLTNRIIAFFSHIFFYSFPEAKNFVKNANSKMTGNPVRTAVFEIRKKSFDIPKSAQVIYITGGSLGSHSLNDHVKHILPQLLSSYIVIHQTGAVKEYGDYEKLVRYRRTLAPELKSRYFPVEHIFEDEIGYVYSVADLVIGRSGANTFFELIQLKKPAVFIPLPWSANKEQQQHAEFFRSHGIGEVFEQKDDSVQLLGSIRKIMDLRKQYVANFDKLPMQIQKNAAESIIQEVLKK